ncbi:Receptor-like protein kinase [Arachis hypogaea]|nr:Receptor-like protein kinase [Arachis hypogaea]
MVSLTTSTAAVPLTHRPFQHHLALRPLLLRWRHFNRLGALLFQHLTRRPSASSQPPPAKELLHPPTPSFLFYFLCSPPLPPAHLRRIRQLRRQGPPSLLRRLRPLHHRLLLALPWPSSLSRRGAYSDLLASSPSDADAVPVCFYSFATDPPVISSLELFSVDPNSYDAASTATTDIVLVNYGRLSCGSGQWGPGFSADSDRFGRSWQADSDYRTANSDKFVAVSTKYGIKGTDQKPNYFPEKLYQTAVTTAEEEGGVIEYELSVDAKLDYLLWLHFAEIEGKVRKAGERVFDVWVNGENLTRIDIYRSVGGFAAYTWHHTVKNLSSSALSVKFKGVKGAPLISVAMKALKDSLRIPERMGWNGDPCAPTNWDAWEGVTCRMSKDNTGLVISQIDLGSQGLKGDISDQISLLSDLVSLNLSSNSLMGEIPNGLGQKSLIHLDLSNNQLTGSIPDSIASSSLKLVLLNGNLLEGRVPEELYSIGVHGGAIDLSSNKGLCGVPTLPSCPIFGRMEGYLLRVKLQ